MHLLQRTRILNGNTIKFLAAALMVIDHIGVIFFPNTLWLRAVGRLSMPLFAFMISEGCRYTKNKAKHFLLLFSLALVCQIVYYFFDNGNLYMSILVTFSLSVVCIYALQFFKKKLFESKKLSEKMISGAIFLLAITFTYFFNEIFTVDYFFIGCLLPVFASLFDFRGIRVPERLQKLDCLPARIACFGVGCVIAYTIYIPINPVSFYMFLALPLLLAYNGEKGKLKSKYFFYVFYPLHLAILEGIYMLMQIV